MNERLWVAAQSLATWRNGLLSLYACDSDGELKPSEVPADANRGMSGYDSEALCAVAAALSARKLAESRCDRSPLPEIDVPASRCLVWQTENAGLSLYAAVLDDAFAAGATPRTVGAGPRSSYNGPGSAVSIKLDIGGPHILVVAPANDPSRIIAEVSRLGRGERRDGSLIVGMSASSLTEDSARALAISFTPAGAMAASSESQTVALLTVSNFFSPARLRQLFSG